MIGRVGVRVAAVVVAGLLAAAVGALLAAAGPGPEAFVVAPAADWGAPGTL